MYVYRHKRQVIPCKRKLWKLKVQNCYKDYMVQEAVQSPATTTFVKEAWHAVRKTISTSFDKDVVGKKEMKI